MADFMKKVIKPHSRALLYVQELQQVPLCCIYVKIQSPSECGPSEDDFDEDRTRMTPRKRG